MATRILRGDVRAASCKALAGTPLNVPVILDPFGGAGTTALVADREQRDCILIELNPEYADMAARRLKGESPLLAEVAE